MAQSSTAENLADLPLKDARAISFRETTTFEWLFIVLGGLPFYLPVLFLLGERGLSSSDPIYWYFWVNAAISSPHVWSTYARLSRKIGERKVSRWMGAPLYLTICGILALATQTGHFVEAMTAVNLWQSVHYCRQMYGASRLVSRNRTDDDLIKTLSFYGFHLAIPLFVLGRWNLLFTVWQGRPSSTIIPVHVTDWVMAICWGLALLGVGLGLFAEWRSYKSSTGTWSPARLATFVIYYAIHIFGFLSVTFYQRGFFAVTIFHAVQYLAIVWLLEQKSPTGRVATMFRRRSSLFAFPLFWLILFVVGYVVENQILVRANAIWPLVATIALAAISAHHYSVDTVMWRRKAGA